MEATRAEASQTMRLTPVEPAGVSQKSKDLWSRLRGLHSNPAEGQLPAWAYSGISEIRAALGEEFERVFSSHPDRLVVRIGVPELDRPAELKITFEQPGTWHAEALDDGVRAGDVLLDITEWKSTRDADALSKARQGLERIKAIQI